MNPARGGLGYLVYTTSATVVPVAISTFFNISSVDFFLRRHKVVITIGKSMSAGDIIQLHQNPEPTVDDFRNVSQVVLDRVREMI